MLAFIDTDTLHVQNSLLKCIGKHPSYSLKPPNSEYYRTLACLSNSVNVSNCLPYSNIHCIMKVSCIMFTEFLLEESIVVYSL